LANNSGSSGSWVILANESAVPDNGGINSISVSNGTTYAGTGGYDLNNNLFAPYSFLTNWLQYIVILRFYEYQL